MNINDRITIKSKNKCYLGIIRYFGEIEGKNGQWVGVELDRAIGKNDGSYQGRYYFHCQKNHGIFIRYGKVSDIKNDNIKSADKNFNKNDYIKKDYMNDNIMYDDYNINNKSSVKEIISKYSNYKLYDEENKNISDINNIAYDVTDNNITNNNIDNIIDNNINNIIDNNIDNNDFVNLLNSHYNSLLLIEASVDEITKKVSKIPNHNFEHTKVTMLLAEIFSSYIGKDFERMNKLCEEFDKIMKERGIEL